MRKWRPRHKKDLAPKQFEYHPILVVWVEILKDTMHFSSLTTSHGVLRTVATLFAFIPVNQRLCGLEQNVYICLLNSHTFKYE